MPTPSGRGRQVPFLLAGSEALVAKVQFRGRRHALKLLLCLLGTALVALGVAGQGIADVLMLAGEGAVYVFARKFHIDFGKVKVGNDISLVAIAAIVSVLTMGTIEGIREGTLISALLTGIIARFSTCAT